MNATPANAASDTESEHLQIRPKTAWHSKCRWTASSFSPPVRALSSGGV